MPANPPEVKVIHRLSKEAYEALEQQLTVIKPTTNTTSIEAGFVLGEQNVMKILRKGFVIG